MVFIVKLGYPGTYQVLNLCLKIPTCTHGCGLPVLWVVLIFLSIGLLQQTITWYKIRHAGGQAHYYSRTGMLKQRPVTLDWLRSLCFNVPVRE